MIQQLELTIWPAIKALSFKLWKRKFCRRVIFTLFFAVFFVKIYCTTFCAADVFIKSISCEELNSRQHFLLLLLYWLEYFHSKDGLKLIDSINKILNWPKSISLMKPPLYTEWNERSHFIATDLHFNHCITQDIVTIRL